MARKILMIDDDRMQFRLTQAHFEKFQAARYDLEWAETYEDGLAKLLGGGYTACLLDYQLGDRDGLQLLREAVAAGCATPIVFVTAESSAMVDIEAMNAGALDYLVKGEITASTLERSLRYARKLGETLQTLREMATRDLLTGLMTRREFERLLSEEAERSRRFEQPVALVMIDIDHFKSVNDTHGHPVGDVVLREVGRRLPGLVRAVDRVARYGGEEFALLLVQTDRPGALELARHVCASVSASPVTLKTGEELNVTVSAGVAALFTDAADMAGLIAAADKALYAAKTRGRNRAVGFDEV